ncbi:MAG: hypothetical protein AABY15_03155 [Nanoarchaeota archaeon]
MKEETLDKLNQYLFIKENLYKGHYVTQEEDKGLFVDKEENSFYHKFKSIGVIGENGPEHHAGEIASYRLYVDEDGEFSLLFENSGHVDEIEDFQHLIYLLDPKTLDLRKN